MMVKKDVDPFTAPEVERMFDVCGNMEEDLIITFIAESGCRENELLRLEPEWAVFDEGKYGTLIVPVQATSGKKPKTKKIKHIPMTKRLSVVLEEVVSNKEWMRTQRERAAVYRSEKRMIPKNPVLVRTPQHIWNTVRRIAKRAGVTKRAYPHLFRHYFITRCYYDGGLDKEEIGALAGHRDGEMVGTTYLHIDDEKTRSKLEDAGFLE